MKRTTEDKIIATLAIIGMMTVLALVTKATNLWLDPFFSFDTNGHPTIIGRAIVLAIYAIEAIWGLVTLWLAFIAFTSFIPQKQKA